MAPCNNENINSLLFSQLPLYLAFLFQLNEIVITYKLLEAEIPNSRSIYMPKENEKQLTEVISVVFSSRVFIANIDRYE